MSLISGFDCQIVICVSSLVILIQVQYRSWPPAPVLHLYPASSAVRSPRTHRILIHLQLLLQQNDEFLQIYFVDEVVVFIIVTEETHYYEVWIKVCTNLSLYLSVCLGRSSVYVVQTITELTYCRSSCRRPAAVVPQDRHSSKILECWHTGAHSHAPLCYTGSCLQKQFIYTLHINYIHTDKDTSKPEKGIN